MSGLPGTGKDAYIKQNLSDLPVISLDDLRDEMKIAPEDGPDLVLARAREIAKEDLRAKRPFVWNATNIADFARAPASAFAAITARPSESLPRNDLGRNAAPQREPFPRRSDERYRANVDQTRTADRPRRDASRLGSLGTPSERPLTPTNAKIDKTGLTARFQRF